MAHESAGFLCYNISMFRRVKADGIDALSIDGMRDKRIPEANAVVLDADDLPWQTDVDDAPSLETEQLRLHEEMQQNKIINFFSIDEKSLVTAEEIVGSGPRGLKNLKRERIQQLRREILEGKRPEMTPEKRQQFLRRLARGEISQDDERDFLLLIRDPLHLETVGAKQMFDKIMADPRQTQILAVVAGYNVKNWQSVDQDTLYRLLDEVQTNGEDLRTPLGFELAKRRFLDGIRPKAKPGVYQCYLQSMRELEETLYGKRLEYYQQFENLRRLAQDGQKTTVNLATAAHLEVKDVSKERSAEMLGRAMIAGTAWRGGKHERLLNTHNLAELQLGPGFETVLEGRAIYWSKQFALSNGYRAVLGYVTEQGSYKVRAFYRDPAQGLWRYLPDYVRSVNGGIESLGTGYSLEAVTVPFELQAALQELDARGEVLKLKPELADFAFAGTAYAYANSHEYQTLWVRGQLQGDYYREVSRDPINEDGSMVKSPTKKAPYTLGIDYARSPDFNRPKVRFEANVLDAGPTTMEGFVSQDGQYLWLFCRDEKNRVWINQVEAISPLSTCGVRRDYVVMPDFTTPLYEYTSKAGIYGDRSDTRGAKQCMWRKYLSNVPLIQEYIARRG